jgi:hypothetical protein
MDRRTWSTLIVLGAILAGCDSHPNPIDPEAPPGPDAPETPSDPTGPVVGSISLVLDSYSLSVGQTTRLRPTVLDADGDRLDGQVVTFRSSNVGIATVSGDGLVAGEGPGRATLTASIQGVSATTVIFVRRAASISVAPSDTTVDLDSTLRLSVTARDADGDLVDAAPQFAISDRTVLTSGETPSEFRAVGVGHAVITIVSEGLIARANVRVRPTDVRSVILSPNSLTVAVYDVARLAVVVRDTTGAVIANPTVEFLVYGLAEGTVDPTGLVTGLPGRCGDGTVVARSRGVLSNMVAIHIGSESGAGCWDY